MDAPEADQPLPGEASETIGVVVVAGHPVIRDVIRLACQEAPDLELIAELDRVEGAADAVVRAAPDVVVIDRDLPDGDGLSILRSLRMASFSGRSLILSDDAEGDAVIVGLRHGVGGYVMRTLGLRVIAEAIRGTAAGERLLAPELERAALEAVNGFAAHARESADVASSLTPRELQALAHLADGLTMQQIGRRLGISPRTAEYHVSRLYRKLGVDSRVRAVARAAALDLIEL